MSLGDMFDKVGDAVHDGSLDIGAGGRQTEVTGHDIATPTTDD